MIRYVLLVVALLINGCVAPPFYEPILKGDRKAFDTVLTNYLNSGNKSDYNINSALVYAVLKDQYEFADRLFDSGADINKSFGENLDGDWFTFAYLCYHHGGGTEKQFNYLVAKGFDVELYLDRYQDLAKEYSAWKPCINTLKRRAAKIEKQKNQTVFPVPPTPSAVPQIATPINSDIDTLPNVKTKTNLKNYAVVIGIESYRQKLPKADHATNDAKTVTSYLTKALGYPEENVITITDDRAAKSDLEKYIDKWLKNNVEKDATVFVYYSGHGAPNPANGDAYLVPYDGDPAFIDETGYSLKRLYANLEKLPAKNIVVALDACFSGAGGKSVAAKGSRALVRVEKTTARNIAVLTASADNQISSSYDDKGHGVFTYFLLKGMKGMLEEDKYAKLEIGELYNYLKPQVEKTSRKLYNNEQTPQLIAADEQMKRIGLR